MLEVARRSALTIAVFALITAGAACAPARTGSSGSADSLKLATWNLEWLIAPEEFKALKKHCTPADEPPPGRARQIPCDVAYELQRGARDFRALAHYASVLDADVVALQEVDGVSAARLVFPGYDFCFTSRPQVQNTGFAIRAGLPHRCDPDLHTLSRRDRLRRGAHVVIYPGEPRELHLLSVHLKSGCSRDPLNSPSKACAELAGQVPALEAWVDARALAGERFAVLGDFNRDLLGEPGPARAAGGQLIQMWPELDDGDPPEANLVNAAEHAPFRNCWAGQGYGAYIDYIVLSRSLGTALVPGSFERVTYSSSDARHIRLSDHCPVAARIRLR